MTALRLSLLVGLAAAMVRLAAPMPLELLDLKALDLRQVLRGPRPPGGEVVIVALDEASLAAHGRWPWPRAQVAALVDAITAAEPAALGLDVVFDQRDEALDLLAAEREVAAAPDRPAAALLDLLRGLGDRQLATALRGSGRAVLALFGEIGPRVHFGDAPEAIADGAPQLVVRLPAGTNIGGTPGLLDVVRLHLPLPELAKAAGASGHVNFLPDIDGLYRRAPLVLRAGERLVPAFSLELLRRYRRQSPMAVIGSAGLDAVRVGDLVTPVDAAGQVWVNHLGPPQTFPFLSAIDLLRGRVAPEALRGRIAIIGLTAAGNDEVATPFAAVAPGVEMQAALIDNLLHGQTLQRPWWMLALELVVILLGSAGIGVVVDRVGGGLGSTVALAVMAAYAVVTQSMFVYLQTIMSAVYPLGAMAASAFGSAIWLAVTEGREKRQIRQAFQQYVSPAITELLANDPKQLRLGGERRPLTILFSDIRGFTSLCERLSPEALAHQLNEHLDAMTHAIFRHEGLLDKYIGDALMAFWGAPISIPDHAVRCCDAALDMLVTLERLHARWQQEGRPLLRIGIGINTGEAVVGNFGSSVRFDYTAVGDAVNIAARLETLTASKGVGILISESTREAIGDAFECREVDRLQVKGREQYVTVYELLRRRVPRAGH